MINARTRHRNEFSAYSWFGRAAVFALLLLLLGGMAAPIAARGQEKPLTALQGTWKPQRVELQGRQIALPGSILLTVTGDRYRTVVSGTVDEGTLSVDASQDPTAPTMSGVRGPNANKKILAIYKLEDGKLTIAYQLEGEQRPKDFEPNPQNLVITYQQARPEARD